VHGNGPERDAHRWVDGGEAGHLDRAKVRPLSRDRGDQHPQHHEARDAEPDEKGDHNDPAPAGPLPLPDDDAGTGGDDGRHGKRSTSVHDSSLTRRGR
jgi:hypothetical protein